MVWIYHVEPRITSLISGYNWTPERLGRWLSREMDDTEYEAKFAANRFSGRLLTQMADVDSELMRGDTLTFKDEVSKIVFAKRCYTLLIFGDLQSKLNI